jgi:hypothetical protein
MSAVRNRYRTTTVEDRLRRLSVNCKVCELAIALQLFVVTSCVYKCSINQITNPNPVYSHINTRNNIFFWLVTYTRCQYRLSTTSDQMMTD